MPEDMQAVLLGIVYGDDERITPADRVRAAELGLTRALQQLLVRFLADSGLRIGEALALTWGHVDFGRGRVLVRRRVYKGSYAPPKSKAGRRDVPLAPGLAQQLWAHRAACKGRDEEPVFVGRKGEPLDASTCFRAVKAAGKRAGVPWAGLHTLRHTCATRLFRSGANAKQVQAWLGHHSPAFTLAVYVHLLPGDLPDAAFLDALAQQQSSPRQASRPSRTATAAITSAASGSAHHQPNSALAPRPTRTAAER